MKPSLARVDTMLSERYSITCAYSSPDENVACGYIRVVFGTEQEAKDRALKMGWMFRMEKLLKDQPESEHNSVERAYCPHCKAFVPEGS